VALSARRNRPQRSGFALLQNPYDVELVRDGQRWVIRRMRIDSTWYLGDPVAIFS
jgi:hypothetical protein